MKAADIDTSGMRRDIEEAAEKARLAPRARSFYIYAILRGRSHRDCATSYDTTNFSLSLSR